MVDPQVYGLAGLAARLRLGVRQVPRRGQAVVRPDRVPRLDFNIFSAQDVRPDLGFGEYQTHDALNRVVYIPIMDRTSSQPTVSFGGTHDPASDSIP